MDNHTLIDHAKPHCTSRELYKGILDGRSRGVFHGKIIVRPDAQKTDALQTNKNLLLSREALVNSTPALEILADDVKCRHGSTIGQLDANSLFYLRSRGIGEQEARALLTYGFAADLTRRIRVPWIREEIEALPGPAPPAAGGGLMSTSAPVRPDGSTRGGLRRPADPRRLSDSLAARLRQAARVSRQRRDDAEAARRSWTPCGRSTRRPTRTSTAASITSPSNRARPTRRLARRCGTSSTPATRARSSSCAGRRRGSISSRRRTAGRTSAPATRS